MLTATWFASAQFPEPHRAKLGQPLEAPSSGVILVSAQQMPDPKSLIPTIPISLPAALQLANVNPIDIQLAQQRVAFAAAQLQRAELLWLPTIYLGVDYYRHDGQLQDVTGNVFGTSKDAFMIGAAPTAVFATTEAIFAPLAARQDVRAQNAALQATRNDSLLAVAETYFNVQQARGEIAGAEATLRDAEELVRRADKLAPGLVPPVEAIRARTEMAKRKQVVSSARERWRVASADLCRLLRLDAATPVEPVEPPFLQVDLVRLDTPVEELIAVGLTNRPELAQQQALVQATLQRLRQEKFRPLLPSVVLRGASTNPAGTLAGGYFGGGVNDNMSNFQARGDFDVQVLWELQNLGFGNHARVKEKQAEHELANYELLRVQDLVAAEVVQSFTKAQEAHGRVKEAEIGLKLAAESVQKNFEGLSQTKRLGADVVILVIRPQEVIAAIQALAQAHSDYYTAVGDYDRAQFRLYRALGQPAQMMLGHDASPLGLCK